MSLASEKVVVQSPTSFVGSAKRIWRLTDRSDNQWVQWLVLIPVAIVLVACAWVIVAVWTLLGLLILPIMLIYRMMRRGARRNKATELRHREMLDAVETDSGASPPAD